MNLTVTRKALLEGLQIVSRAVSHASSLPVLKNVLIEAGMSSILDDGPQEGLLRLAATDLELGVEYIVPCRITQPGSLTVPAKTFAELVNSLPEADITLAVNVEDRLDITCRASAYTQQGLPAEDMPALPTVEATGDLVLPQPTLKRMLKEVLFAVSDDDTRPILTGVLLRVENGKLTLVATDTHRLAVTSFPVDPALSASMIIPARALTEMLKPLSDDPERMVTVRVGNENQVEFRTERLKLISRLIEGSFPKYERVIPSKYSRRWTIERDSFQSCLKRASIVAREAAAKDRVILATDGERLTISATGEDGEAHEEMEIAREGDELSIAFNVQYLQQALASMQSEGVFLEATESLSAAILRPLDNPDHLVTLMPMQVQ